MTDVVFRESPVVVEGDAPLLGSLTRPSRSPGRIGVVLLNAGLVQRAGPDRLYVRLARALAARGFPTLRLDYSGIGDSPARRDRAPIEQARTLETRSALDRLARDEGLEGFVLAGICTGADAAWVAALADERVRGVVLLDGYPYRTVGWWIRHYLPRAFRTTSWRGVLRRGLAPPRPLRDPEAGWAGMARDIPPRALMASQLRTLIERGTHSYFIYTGGFQDWYNHAGQFRAAFRRVRFHGRVKVDYLPEADHIFRAAASQETLERRLCDWLEARWPDR